MVSCLDNDANVHVLKDRHNLASTHELEKNVNWNPISITNWFKVFLKEVVGLGEYSYWSMK